MILSDLRPGDVVDGRYEVTCLLSEGERKRTSSHVI
jgi:hypothetical protein